MNTIWKTTVQPMAFQQIMVPDGAEMLCAREQFDHICVWYRCDPSAPLKPRQIAAVGTGQQSTYADGKYLGSAILQGGQFVFHVFELPAA